MNFACPCKIWTEIAVIFWLGKYLQCVKNNQIYWQTLDPDIQFRKAIYSFRHFTFTSPGATFSTSPHMTKDIQSQCLVVGSIPSVCWQHRSRKRNKENKMEIFPLQRQIWKFFERIESTKLLPYKMIITCLFVAIK